MKLPIGKIICGDCEPIIKDWQDNRLLILTDPPYGINYFKIQGTRPKEKKRKKFVGDKKNELDLTFLFNRPELRIIFGAENYWRLIPSHGKWLCWDKRVKPIADNVLGSPIELAWISRESGYYKQYRVMHGGVINDDDPCKPRFHPTQKPINLMKSILKDFAKKDSIILDPFVGSGTTCIAAERLGLKWIGIDIDEEYCKIARKRIVREKRNPPLLGRLK